jgi:hypothetical protein
MRGKPEDQRSKGLEVERQEEELTRLVSQKTKIEERKDHRIRGREEQRIRRLEDKKR